MDLFLAPLLQGLRLQIFVKMIRSQSLVFLPCIFLVYIVFPVWQRLGKNGFFEYFLKGVVISASALIALTALLQFIRLPLSLDVWSVFIIGLWFLLQKKGSVGWLVLTTVILGFIL